MSFCVSVSGHMSHQMTPYAGAVQQMGTFPEKRYADVVELKKEKKKLWEELNKGSMQNAESSYINCVSYTFLGQTHPQC